MLLISNNPNALCLERARTLAVPAAVVDHRRFSSREDFDEALVDELKRNQVELVCLAGFMRLLTPVLLDAFPQRVINVHPALLPSFSGTHGARDALDYGVKGAGCTVHFVDRGTDTGPIISQAAVAVQEDDDGPNLSTRIQREEHRLFPAAVRAWAEGRLTIDGRRVRVRPE